MSLNFEIIIGLLEVVFGIGAVNFIAKAKGLLGGLWAETLGILQWALVLLTAGALSHTTREAFELKAKYGAVVEYPEYLFGILAFAGFLWSSSKIIKVASE